jgi:uncharacterized protein YecA (UPF0149 family)
MEIPEILAHLKDYNGRFPRSAVEAAITKRDEITPELLAILERDAENIEVLAEQDDYMGHIYAMYLLAQFREPRAYPLIYKFFSVPGEISLDVTGDLVTEHLAPILASVSCGDISLITQLAENRAANEYVRSAALSSLLALVNSGERTREDVVDYYRGFLQLKASNEDPYVLANLVCCLTDLYPEEAYAEIKQAFNDNLIDESVLDLNFVDQVLAEGKEQTLAKLKNREQLITDTIAEMEGWYCFQEQESKQKTPVKKTSKTMNMAKSSSLGRPYVRPEKKVGRNEPCPCGSGKKYKKCCGANL